MSYLRQAFQDLYEQDGLLVMGRGLGLRHVLVKFIRYYCDHSGIASSGTPSAGKRRLVFVVNAKGEEDLLVDAVAADGVPPHLLPRVLTNEFTIKEREALYKDGGVFIVTSRILIVDLLNDVVDPGAVGGFLVHHAHRLEETSTEAFILRMYRARNHAGFVKGFSEDPEALVRGFGRAEKALRALHVARLYVWPRFRAEVAEALERVKPDLHEWLQDLTPGMAAVQQAVAVTMDVCLRELRRRAPALDVAELTVENGLFEAFDASLRRQLDPEWHRVRPETRQLVADLSTLRKLLDYLFRYDCVTFYGFLQAVRAASAAGGRGGGGSALSMWLSMDAADRLFEQAKARVYRVVATEKAAQHGGGGSSGGGGGGAGPNGAANGSSAAAGAAQGMRLVRVLEQNPKWHLVDDMLQQARAEAAAEGSAAGGGGGGAPVGGPCMLIMVKDESTAAQLLEHLSLGGAAMMRRRFLRFLANSNAKARRRQAAAAAAASGGGGGGGASDAAGTSNGASNGGSSGGYKAGQAGGSQGDSVVVRAAALEQQLLLAEEEALRKELQADGGAGGRGGAAATAAAAAAAAASGPKLKGKGSRARQKGAKKTGEEGSGVAKAPSRKGKAAAAAKAKGKAGGVNGGGGGGGAAAMAAAAAAQRKRRRAIMEAHGGEERGDDDAYEAEARIVDQGLLSTVMEAESHGSFVDDDGDDGGGGGGGVAGVTVEPLSGAHAIVCTYARAAERLSLLDELRPRWVLMYDPDVAFVRELELHAATRGAAAAAAGAAAAAPPPLTVHFAVYRDSAEHQRFLTALRREAKAFETLIEEKGRMVVSVAATDAPGAAAAPVPLSLDTRTGPQRRRARAGPPTAVVDVREFRSALPSLLHARGFRLAPLTIAVGDYVLSPELCVERKSVADLFSSFASGRLWNQADAMARWYRKPALLIEFSAERAFGLQGSGELSSDIKVDAICSKMALLTMHFPQLRVLWSRSPHATVAIFEALMRNEAPVDAAAALAAGSDAAAAAAGADPEGDGVHAAARELLLRLPGVTASNFRALMRAGGSVAGVAALSLPQLTAAMGRVGARQLYNFVREQPNL